VSAIELDHLSITAVGGVRVVTLDRPDFLNVVNGELHRSLVDVWRLLDRDPDARAVLLTGAGKAFSAGGDFQFLKRQHQSLDSRYMIQQEVGTILREMITFRLPVVAAINGPAIGLGASLALSADLVVMAEKAFLQDPHVSIGLTAGDGGALHWPHLIGMARAKEFLYLGNRMSAQEAFELGVANRVAAPEDLFDTALDLAQRLAKQPARALQSTKRALSLHIAQTAVPIIDYGATAELVELGAPEHIELIRDFLGAEKYDAIEVDSKD